mgnify:CR=1 FL=1
MTDQIQDVQPKEQPQDLDIRLTLKVSQINIILAALDEIAHKFSRPVIDEIVKQLGCAKSTVSYHIKNNGLAIEHIKNPTELVKSLGKTIAQSNIDFSPIFNSDFFSNKLKQD